VTSLQVKEFFLLPDSLRIGIFFSLPLDLNGNVAVSGPQVPSNWNYTIRYPGSQDLNFDRN
jgi:hypothetical protein